MTIRLRQVAEIVASEMLALVQLVVNEAGGGSLSDSHLRERISAKIEQQEESIVISLLFENYIGYIENGRAPKQGKRPPLDALRQWALDRGIPPDNDTLFAISEAIWRDGIEPRPIFSTLEERLAKQFGIRWADMLFDALSDDLTKYFNV